MILSLFAAAAATPKLDGLKTESNVAPTTASPHAPNSPPPPSSFRGATKAPPPPQKVDAKAIKKTWSEAWDEDDDAAVIIDAGGGGDPHAKHAPVVYLRGYTSKEGKQSGRASAKKAATTRAERSDSGGELIASMHGESSSGSDEGNA